MDLDGIALIKDNNLLKKIKNIISKNNIFSDFKFLKDSKKNRKKINIEKPKVLILENELRNLIGVEFRSNLTYKPFTIFISNSWKPEKEAVDLNCIDYIVKPVSMNKLENSIKKIEKNKDFIINTFSFNKKIRIKCCNKIMFFHPNDIIYITKDGRYSIIKTKEKDYLCSKPLKYLEKKLEKHSRIRVRRNYLVNMKFVKKIQKKDSRKYIIELSIKKKKIKVGIRYIDEIVNSQHYIVN